jgi:hypothetical protein
MANKVNGNARAGEFLSGNMDFYSIATIVPVAQTNVDVPVVDLPGYANYVNLGSWTTVTVVNGAGTAVDYATLNAYLDAFYQQRNLDKLVSCFAARANPVAISVKTLASSINGAAINANTSAYFAQAGYTNSAGSHVFGSSFTTGKTISIVNIATEKSGLWVAAGAGDNVTGYSLLSANSTAGGLHLLAAYDTQSAQVFGDSTSTASDAWTVKNTVAPYVNAFDTSAASTGNTMLVSGAALGATTLA